MNLHSQRLPPSLGRNKRRYILPWETNSRMYRKGTRKPPVGHA
jgi:hypothetical protein